MFSRKQLKPLALMAILGFLAMTAAAQGTQKRRKRILMLGGDDPYLLFVAGQPLLVAAEHGRAAVLLRYPELEIVRKLDGPANQTLESLKTSPNGKWLAAFFHVNSFHVGGTLRVWNPATGESNLLLDDASMAYAFHPAEERIVVWQPKGGLTQWTLGEGEGKQAGPVIANVRVFRDLMEFSSDGRYALLKGGCKDKVWFDICVVSLVDGSMAAHTNMTGNTTDWEPGFAEVLTATKLTKELTSKRFFDDKTDERAGFHVTAYSECKELGKNRLCYSALAVSGSTPGLPSWQMRPRDDLDARMVTSFAASADGRWMALGIDGVSVLLFDTSQLDPNGKPTLVKRFEMP